MIRCS